MEALAAMLRFLARRLITLACWRPSSSMCCRCWSPPAARSRASSSVRPTGSPRAFGASIVRNSCHHCLDLKEPPLVRRLPSARASGASSSENAL